MRCELFVKLWHDPEFVWVLVESKNEIANPRIGHEILVALAELSFVFILVLEYGQVGS